MRIRLRERTGVTTRPYVKTKPWKTANSVKAPTMTQQHHRGRATCQKLTTSKECNERSVEGNTRTSELRGPKVPDVGKGVSPSREDEGEESTVRAVPSRAKKSMGKKGSGHMPDDKSDAAKGGSTAEHV